MGFGTFKVLSLECWNLQFQFLFFSHVNPVSPLLFTDGVQYYEQYKMPVGWFKVGDHVYLKNVDDPERMNIARIDKIWTEQE